MANRRVKDFIDYQNKYLIVLMLLIFQFSTGYIDNKDNQLFV